MRIWLGGQYAGAFSTGAENEPTRIPAGVQADGVDGLTPISGSHQTTMRPDLSAPGASYLQSCPSRGRTWTLLLQRQTCCQLHQGAITKVPARCTLHDQFARCTLHDLLLAARRPIHTSRTRTRILVTPTPLINRPTTLISAEIPGSPAPTPGNPADWVAPPSDWPRSRPVRADFALSPECSAYPGMPARAAPRRQRNESHHRKPGHALS